METQLVSPPTLDIKLTPEQSTTPFVHRQLLFKEGGQKALEASLKSNGFKISTNSTKKATGEKARDNDAKTDAKAKIDAQIEAEAEAEAEQGETSILLIVPIGHDVYDIAVLGSKLPQFDEQYKQYKREPLGEGDPLIKAYGLRKALLKTVNRYNDVLRGGVSEEAKPWLRVQIVRLAEVRNEIIGGMTAVLAPFGLGMDLDRT